LSGLPRSAVYSGPEEILELLKAKDYRSALQSLTDCLSRYDGDFRDPIPDSLAVDWKQAHRSVYSEVDSGIHSNVDSWREARVYLLI
jgi:hypothetical protein